MLEETKLKIDYHHWANIKMLNHIRTLGPEIFLQEVKSVFPSIAATFSHIYLVDRRWLKRMRGTSETAFEEIKFTSPEAAMEQFETLYQDYNKLDLHDRTIIYQNTQGEKFENQFEDIIQHVVNHGTYHRGNIAAILRQLGHMGVSTDYIFFLRDQTPDGGK